MFRVNRSFQSVALAVVAVLTGCEKNHQSLLIEERAFVDSANSYCSRETEASADCYMKGQPAAIFWEQDLMAALATDSTCSGIQVYTAGSPNDKDFKMPPVQYPALTITFQPKEPALYWVLQLSDHETPIRAIGNPKDMARMVCSAIKGNGAKLPPR
jgi:hypothetical protein